MVAPVAPHVAEELWRRMGKAGSVAYVDFPQADPALLVTASVTYPVQVNGKVRGRVEVPTQAAADEVRAAALAAVGVVVLVVGLWPLLPKGTFRVRPGVSAPIALRGLLAGTFFGVEALIPLSLSVQHGYGATAAGLPLAVSGFSWSAGSWWQGRVDDAAHPQRRIALIRAGFVLNAVAALGMAAAALPSLPGGLAYPAWMLAGLGAGFTMSSVSVLMLKYTNDADRGSDSAALQLSDATASALTTGLAGVLVAAAARGAIGNTAAFVTLDVVMCGVALVGALLAGRARSPKTVAAVP
jgi:hypothetical protein